MQTVAMLLRRRSSSQRKPLHSRAVFLWLGLPLSVLTATSGATLLGKRLIDGGGSGTEQFTDGMSALALLLCGLGLGAAFTSRWHTARGLGTCAVLAGLAAVLVSVWRAALLSSSPGQLAWLWSPVLHWHFLVVLVSLGLTVAQERTTSLVRLGVLCLAATSAIFVSASLVLVAALDFPSLFIGGSLAWLALGPAERQLLVSELAREFSLPLRSLGTALGGACLLLLAWWAEVRAGQLWPRWLAPIVLLFGLWTTTAMTGTLWMEEHLSRTQPGPGSVPRAATPLPELAFLFGLITTFLLTLAVRQTERVTEAIERERLSNWLLQDEIAQRRFMQELLTERETRLRLVLEQAPAIVWTTDRDFRFTSATGAGLKVLGLDGASLLGKWIGELIPDDLQRASLLQRYQRALGGEPQEFTLDFGSRLYTMQLEPLRDTSGGIVGVVGVALDMTEQKQLEEQLRRLALYDPLTGLANRAHLLEELAELSSSGRACPQWPFALLLLDLDGFKRVNDTLGHAAGDALLVEVGRRLAGSVRGDDLVGRLGGDEFVVLARGADERAAVQLAERIARRLREPIAIGGELTQIGCSIGIAIGRPGGNGGADLLRDADIALYRAKALGRGRAVVFEPWMYHETREEAVLIHRLREAIDQDQLVLRYRPVVELRSGQISGFEVSAHWQHPERGDVPVDELARLAREASLAEAIARWSLHRASGWLTQFADREQSPVVILRLSGLETTRPGFAEEIARAIEESGVPGASLGFRLMEASLAFGTGDSRELIRSLRDLGSPVFVSGLSDLASIFSVAELRLTGVVIPNDVIGLVGSDTPASAVARVIIGLAKELGLISLAEGVDGFEQFVPLGKLGCTLGMGALFGPLLDGEIASRVAREAHHWSHIRKLLAAPSA
jgi:diguanylate cyclase (GGDEF)-like protein/PAS domain S-box-containing protein